MTKERVYNAFKATRALGLPDEEVKPVLKNLLKLYNKNWELIEAEDYRALIDSYFELRETEVIKGEKKIPAEDDASQRASKRVCSEEQEDQASSTLDGTSMNDLEPATRKSPQLCAESRFLFPRQSSQKKKDPFPNERVERGRNSPSGRLPGLQYSKQSILERGSSSLQRKKVSNNCPIRDHIKNTTEHTVNGSADYSEPYSVIQLGTLELASTQKNVTHYLASQHITDISKGTENIKISLIDDLGNGDLPQFTYMPHNIIYQSAHLQISLARIADEDCCSSCLGDCLSSPLPCACASETGGEFAYTQQGLLKQEFLRDCVSMKVDPQKHHYVFCQDCPLERSKNEEMPEQCKGHLLKKFIKECWRKCGCDMICGNRVVQRGITCSLQVFCTGEGKGWGLRTLESLPKGAFVCEYVGEILTNMELFERNENSGNERHTYPVTLDADWGSERILRDEEALCLDATFSGNVARFINHRCDDANLIDIPVQVETPDRHYYHLAFFTTREVSKLEELTWDYGIDFDDHDHPIKAFQCCCGSASCRDVKRKRRRNGITRRRGDN